MTGNRMAHPLLISLANIDPKIRSKTSSHAYLLLALLPIPKIIHKTTRVCSLVQDRLFHSSLDLVTKPLKIAASVGVMMNDPVGNLRYCFTPLASYIADTPEESLITATSSKTSPVTVATSKQFGDAVRHPSRTAANTLEDIQNACAECDPNDYAAFLKVIKKYYLNGVVAPFWMDWPLAEPAHFVTPEPLHHFFKFSWDHDANWCITAVGPTEIDFRFSLLQTAVGYRAFEDGISKLKQVTGRDHRSVQRYLVGIIAGAVPRDFVAAIRALADFRYLAQAPKFNDDTLKAVSAALQEFHTYKDAILKAGARTGKRGPINNWEIPKLELLQSVVTSIHAAGPVMQWTADVTEHAHVTEIKIPARSGNNQNYSSQISRHLDRSEKCFRFDLATCIESLVGGPPDLDDDEESHEGHGPDVETVVLESYGSPARQVVDYFSIAERLRNGACPDAPRPYRTFATTTTAFHVSVKPSHCLTVDEAAEAYGLPDLGLALSDFLFRAEHNLPHDASNRRNAGSVERLPFDKLQIWEKLRTQQKLFHDRSTPDSPQTLRIIRPSAKYPDGIFDSVIISSDEQCSWPDGGLEGTQSSLRIQRNTF
jgi:hypothetical protein